MLALEFISLLLHQDGRVVKALDLSSNGRMSAWVRSPLLVKMIFGKVKSYFWTPAPYSKINSHRPTPGWPGG